MKRMKDLNISISEEPVIVPEHFNTLNEVKLKYHLQIEELEEA